MNHSGIDLFSSATAIDYPIIDADAHVNEPPDCWQTRVPAHLRDRAPKVSRVDGGDVWSFNDGKRLRPMGVTAVAGLSYLEYKVSGMTYDVIRPGSWITAERLKDMDADGIFAQVLYPSVTLHGAKAYGSDRELQLACVKAYNDWLAEFCEPSGGRLLGLSVLPATGVEDMIEEMKRGKGLGHRGVIISTFPNGSLDPAPEDDRFWALADELGQSVAVHIGSFLRGAAARPVDYRTSAYMAIAGSAKAGGQNIPVACDLIFSGVCDRFPKLKIVMVEANIGWIPTMCEQLDDMFLRYRWFNGSAEQNMSMPSRVFHRNFHATFMIDTVGMELLHRMNVDHLLWSTDYPHSGTDWPNSRVTIERNFRGLPAPLVKKMLCTNAAALYGIDLSRATIRS